MTVTFRVVHASQDLMPKSQASELSTDELTTGDPHS